LGGELGDILDPRLKRVEGASKGWGISIFSKKGGKT
jgi:hypothetical protein